MKSDSFLASMQNFLITTDDNYSACINKDIHVQKSGPFVVATLNDYILFNRLISTVLPS